MTRLTLDARSNCAGAASGPSSSVASRPNVGVEATARAAHERGFEQVFIEDVMAAREADLHVHSVRRIFPTLGRVRALADVLGALTPT